MGSLGGIQTWEVTVLQSKISSRMYSRCRATAGAFAAILADGSVVTYVTWGDPDRGGDSSAVQDQLRNVQQVEATEQAFAAILANGSVVTWGHVFWGGNRQSKISSRMYSRCRAQLGHLLQS